MRPIFLNALATKITFLFLMLFSSCYLKAQTVTAIKMDMEWLSSTASTAEFQIRLTNTGTSAVTFNALTIRGVHAPNLTSGAITWKALNDNTLPGWFGWPQTGTNNLPIITAQRKLNFSSGTGIFSSANAQVIPSGSGVIVGKFRISTTTTWVPNSDFGFVWEMTSGGVVAYVNGATTVTNIQAFGTVSTATTCASCLTLTASSAQPLNVNGVVPPITASVLSVSSANDTICIGASTNLNIVVTGGNPPYTVIVTDGTNNYSATSSGSTISISVSPIATSTYSIVSVIGGVTGTGNTGAPTVTVTPPALPSFTQVAPICSGATINSLPISSLNNITGTWSPVINNTSTTTYTFTPQVGQCASTTTMTISINSPSVPTFNTPVTPICSGSTLSNISTNGISGAWFPESINTSTTTYTFTPNTGQCATSASTTLTGTQSTWTPSAISACGSYTWDNTGQTYTTSGAYTGTTVNCQTPILNLTIIPSTSNTTTISECGSYTWPNNGQTFTSSGVYTGSTTNCVTQILNLTISSGSTSTSPPPACGTYTWANNDSTYTSSGTYTYVNSCGSLDTLNLTVIPTNNNQTDTIVCGPFFFWSETGADYTTSGIYQSPTVQLNGQCFTEILNLTITPSTTNTTPISACETYTWANNGQTYTTSGIYSGTTVNCITQVINLTITPNSESTISVSACGVYAWNGQTYTTSGIYSYTNSNCFTEILDLTITPSFTNTTTIVSPSSFTWGNTGITYTSSGFYMGSTVNCVTQYLDLTINSSGISEEELVLFSLYPNPVSEALTIDFNGVSNEEYSIIDNFGSVVKRGVLETMSTEISVSELSAGLYYFKIEGPKPRKFSKIN